MEQFSPSTSRIFAAASFVNLYSSIVIVTIRILVAISLGLLLTISFTSSETRVLYLIFSVAVVFFIFEIFYREKILKETPRPLTEGQINLADSFSLEAARLILTTSNLNDPANLMSSLLNNSKVLFVLNKADITAEEINKLLAAASASNKRMSFAAILLAARNWALKEGRNFIDKLDILLALINQDQELKNLLFHKEIKEGDILNIVYWARTQFEGENKRFWENPVETLGP